MDLQKEATRLKRLAHKALPDSYNAYSIVMDTVDKLDFWQRKIKGEIQKTEEQVEYHLDDLQRSNPYVHSRTHLIEPGNERQQSAVDFWASKTPQERLDGIITMYQNGIITQASEKYRYKRVKLNEYCHVAKAVTQPSDMAQAEAVMAFGALNAWQRSEAVSLLGEISNELQ